MMGYEKIVCTEISPHDVTVTEDYLNCFSSEKIEGLLKTIAQVFSLVAGDSLTGNTSFLTCIL